MAIVTKVLAAGAALSLVAADRPATFVAGMALFGFGLAAGGPAQSVLVLDHVRDDRRRTVFAWLAGGQALGMGVGAFVAGYLVDLDRVDGMRPAFTTAALGFAVSAVLVAVAARGVNDLTRHPSGCPPPGVRRRPRCAWSRRRRRCAGRRC